MATLDPIIYLSRLNEFEAEGAIALEKELARRMTTARRITILSAYYSTGYLRDLFLKMPPDQRQKCELTMVFGVEPVSRLIEAVGELRTWRETLSKLRFAKLDIRLVTDRNPFHVKLVHLMNGNRPSYFVGSANASGAIGGHRHELMVRVLDRHPQLQAYMDAVCDGSMPLDGIESNGSMTMDLRSLLLAGYLCYSPIHRVSFTFDAFTLKPSHKQVLRRRIQDVSRVSLADPRTEGFGMSFLGALRRVLGPRDVFQEVDDLQDGKILDEEAETDTKALRWRPYAVETSLGHWVPEAFISALGRRRDEIEAGTRERLTRLGEEMGGVGQDKLDEQLKEYVDELQAFFAEHGAPIEPRRNHVRSFRTWVDTRRKWLTDPGMLSYLASRLVIEPMPDLWAGGSATAYSATKFENSFIEDLVFRLGVPGQNKVAKAMKRELKGKLSTPTGLKAALDRRLKRGFGPRDWTGEEPEEDEDD